jgi:hypothetical protein
VFGLIAAQRGYADAWVVASAVALLAAAAMAVGARLLADDSPAMADPPKESGAEEGAHGEP